MLSVQDAHLDFFKAKVNGSS